MGLPKYKHNDITSRLEGNNRYAWDNGGGWHIRGHAEAYTFYNRIGAVGVSVMASNPANCAGFAQIYNDITVEISGWNQGWWGRSFISYMADRISDRWVYFSSDSSSVVINAYWYGGFAPAFAVITYAQ